MIELPGVPLTEEQLAIVNTCPPRRTTAEKGQLTRVSAAAGTGKTTVLLALALKAVERGHLYITYVSFSKAAAEDGSERLNKALYNAGVSGITVDARTLHSCAKRQLNAYIRQQNPRVKLNSEKWNDKQVKEWIARECKNEIDDFLRPCYDELMRQEQARRQRGQNSSLESRKRAAEKKVVFFIFKSLERFCRSDWSFKDYQRGSVGVGRRDYYPIQAFHCGETGERGQSVGERMGFNKNVYRQEKHIFYAKQASRLWEMAIDNEIRSYDFEMKRAQLLRLKVPSSVLLVDESQDMDSCQVDWIARQQVAFGTHVYVVGDPAQAIYGFRGAKPQCLMELDCDESLMLTQSWRFGVNISNIANLVLFAKEHSPQTARTFDGRPKYWIPYRTRAGFSTKEGAIVRDSLLKHCVAHRKKVTVIARENSSLLIKALEVLGVDSSDEETNGDSAEASDNGCEALSRVVVPKFHINGEGASSGMSKWEKILSQVESVFGLYQLWREDPEVEIQLDATLFDDFAGQFVSWESFCNEVKDQELEKYGAVIRLVSRLKENTMRAKKTFEENVMDNKVALDDADIILATCHSAKGMEWDNVHLCDDFFDLCAYKPKKGGDTQDLEPQQLLGDKKRRRLAPEWMFDCVDWSDDINCLYVACTRAKRNLFVPTPIVRVLETFDAFHQWRQFRSTGVNALDDGMYIEGRGPLSEQQTLDFYDSLVAPLRLEFKLDEESLLMESLLEPLHGDSAG